MPIQRRPTIPDTCDSHLADLIKCCWQEDAKVYMHIDLKHCILQMFFVYMLYSFVVSNVVIDKS